VHATKPTIGIRQKGTTEPTMSRITKKIINGDTFSTNSINVIARPINALQNTPCHFLLTSFNDIKKKRVPLPFSSHHTSKDSFSGLKWKIQVSKREKQIKKNTLEF
jgi:hypothetical protein